MDEPTFRSDYPEFADGLVYPASAVNYWLNLGVLLLNPCRWANLLGTGLELFCAHNLVLEARAQRAAENGALPGETTGPISAKSIDKVSVSYDIGAGLIPEGGDFNLTIYGIRFLRLAQMAGAGGVQL